MTVTDMPDTAQQTIAVEKFYYTAGYSAGWADCRARWTDEFRERVADLQEQIEPMIQAEVAHRVQRMLDHLDGGDGGHARSVARFITERRSDHKAAPKCGCGDWARGYFWRDAMARHGGVIEAEQYGLDFDAVAAEFSSVQRTPMTAVIADTDAVEHRHRILKGGAQ